VHGNETREICNMKNLKTIKQTKMKSIFLAFAIAVISLFTFNVHVAAQYDLGINEEDMPDLSRPVTIPGIPADSTIDNTSKDINERAVKNFQKQFPGIVNPSWYKASDGFIASFKENTMKTRVSYDKKGRFKNIVNYYGEEMLPQDVRKVVKSIYYDYAIISVAEINVNINDAKTTYIVSIQSENSLKILTVYDSEIFSVKEYKTV